MITGSKFLIRIQQEMSSIQIQLAVFALYENDIVAQNLETIMKLWYIKTFPEADLTSLVQWLENFLLS